ncbi:CobW family GTP-binding protein [Shewanella fidelis]|uniref:GTP-binding protein n=1 Tax=Shewanella fidelis TaxID=173509 RepID=A0AAW8NKW0_9GAMM|nr:GTP-binding protein [Shewanella fidelis]MDR8522960.1 GTP-binding protein [Shewanella fidelis]MDW4811714.1 GTP-binding protein [Shewanella fidelis]MDW4815835.1 GTP-binding protein [Shewanella fidelis]MDW4819925.1 GTP-binding protein [Shewanella fidelis]MDW4824101.1 GTP-binding protein [Shewanella fidelis]
MIQKPITTNIITGFLGVGKTSFIKSLLKNKPQGEVWAVLVNEFGEIGLDSGLMGDSQEQVQIKQVAGGCMCCAAGVPMQVAINQLIAKAKPDRLLIEPTGLGHPKEVLKVLTQPHYQQVLTMKACMTLVDARKLDDSRYTEHEIFNQQLQVADVVLASKSDCYDAGVFKKLTDYVANFKSLNSTTDGAATKPPMVPIAQWSTSMSTELHASMVNLLELPHVSLSNKVTAIQAIATPGIQQGEPQSNNVTRPRLLEPNQGSLFFNSSASTQQEVLQTVEFDERGIMFRHKQADGFYSCGWVFDPSYEFDFDKLLVFIKSSKVMRLKAVMITEEGIAGFNCVESELSVIELDDAMDSRIELIAINEIDVNEIEAELLQMSQRLGY